MFIHMQQWLTPNGGGNRTIRQQTNSCSVKSQTGQLVEMF